MKNDKICFSKTFVTLILLIAVVVGGFFLMNYANTQKLGANPKASAACKITPKACSSSPTNVIGSKKLYYYNQIDRKNYKDEKCYQSIPEGVGNYCKGLSGNQSTCVRTYCASPNGSKALYTKGGKYYLNSSCLGVVGRPFYGDHTYNGEFIFLNKQTIENEYCTKKLTEIIPLQYDCPAPNKAQVFYYQNGRYYSDAKKTLDVTGWGVGNFCKISSGTPAPRMSNSTFITCKDISLLPAGAGYTNKGMYAKPTDLVGKSTVDFQNGKVQFFYDSSFSSFIEKVSDYCSAKSTSAAYKAGKTIKYDCSKNVSGSTGNFYMKDNKLTNIDGFLLHPSLTVSNVCKHTSVSMGCYGFTSTSLDNASRAFACDYEDSSYNKKSFNLGFNSASNSYTVDSQNIDTVDIFTKICGCSFSG